MLGLIFLLHIIFHRRRHVESFCFLDKNILKVQTALFLDFVIDVMQETISTEHIRLHYFHTSSWKPLNKVLQDTHQSHYLTNNLWWYLLVTWKSKKKKNIFIVSVVSLILSLLISIVIPYWRKLKFTLKYVIHHIQAKGFTFSFVSILRGPKILGGSESAKRTQKPKLKSSTPNGKIDTDILR